MLSLRSACPAVRSRRGLPLVMLITAGAAAAAQNAVQWGDLQTGVRQAQQSGMPLLFYVAGEIRDTGSELKRAEQDAFRDARVAELAQQRFIPVRVNRNSETKDMLAQMGAPVNYGLYLAVVMPEGKLVGTIMPSVCADPDMLLSRLRELRAQFEHQVAAPAVNGGIQNAGDDPNAIAKQLTRVREQHLTSASGQVVALLNRKDLPPWLRGDACRTLAALSTPDAAQALLDAAVQDEHARSWLHQCTPPAAEALLNQLDLDQPKRLVEAYYAIAIICKLDPVKPREFWTTAARAEQEAEIQRIHDPVFATAAKWQQAHGHLH